jgi:hypothetical protein
MTQRPDDYSELPLPPRLADDLGRLYPPGPPVPPGIEGVILARTQAHFARQRRLNRTLALIGALSAAAAVVLFAVLLNRNPQMKQMAQSKENGAAPTSTVAANEDIDGNGRVDILDAFALARRIESDQAGGAGANVNVDGKPGPDDVKRIALAAVRLGRGTPQ